MKAVLFDLDGVLVDSEPYSRRASDMVLAEVGIVQTPEERRLVYGRRTVESYKAAIEARSLDLDAGELVEKKNRLFAELIKGKLKPMPGVLELLDELKDAGVKAAVVSSSPLDRVNSTLGEVGLIFEFDLILSGDCCVKGKPDPEPYLLAAERLDIKLGECVVVEDAEAGVMAAKAAGMKVVAVESPNTHGQNLSRADVTVKSIKEINLMLLNSL